MEYATSFGTKTVIVRWNPADAVSVPNDCDCQKLRVCKYTVIGDYERPLSQADVSSTSTPVIPLQDRGPFRIVVYGDDGAIVRTIEEAEADDVEGHLQSLDGLGFEYTVYDSDEEPCTECFRYG